jgi:hypothetical protein
MPPWFWHLHGAPGRPIWTISDIQKLFCLADWIRPIQMAQSIKPMLRYWILENHAESYSITRTPPFTIWCPQSPSIWHLEGKVLQGFQHLQSVPSRWHRKRGPQTYFERHGHVSFGNHLAKCPKCPKPEKLGVWTWWAAPNPGLTHHFLGVTPSQPPPGSPGRHVARHIPAPRWALTSVNPGKSVRLGEKAAVHGMNHNELVKMMIAITMKIADTTKVNKVINYHVP